MKRPLAAIGLLYLATSAAAVCLFPEVNFTLCVMAAITAIVACFICREKVRSIIVILSPVCIAFLVIGCCQLSANSLSDRLSDRSCVVSGEICEIPRMQYGRWRYIIETDRVDIPEARQNMRILVTCTKSIEEAREGDRLTCEVNFLPSSSETGYSSTTSLKADGIVARGWCTPYGTHNVEHGRFRLKYIPLKIRRAVTSGIRKALPDRASAMLCGMILGDTDYMDQQTVDGFRTTGIAHLLAVSGLHLTLLALVLEELLKRLKRGRKTTSVTVICFIVMFMAVTGFPPSVVRAGVMHIMAQIGKIAYKNVDSLTSMSIAILLMCILNPWAAADIGLQLSVCSTLGLLLAAGRVNQSILNFTRELFIRQNILPKSRRVRKSGKAILRSVSVSLTASLSILPLTAIHFGNVSLISPITNLLCVYAASMFIIIGIIASLIFCIPFVGWLLSLPLRFAAALLCAYLETVAGGLARLPFSSLNTSYAYTPYLLLFVIILLSCSFIMSKRISNKPFRRRLRGFVLCEIAMLLLAAMLSHQLLCKGAEIVIFDVNNGGMCVCAKNRTHAIFAEAGGDSYSLSVIKQTLHTKGVMKVDAVAVSDDSEPRSGNINRLLDLYSPDWLLTNIDLHKRISATVEPYESCVKNDSLSLTLETFTDSKGGRWERLTSGNAIALICPEKGDCSLLPDSWRSCDAAIVGTDISGVAALDVGAVIITAKENKAAILRKQLENTGFRHVYTTSSSGNITISVKDGRLRVHMDE